MSGWNFLAECLRRAWRSGWATASEASLVVALLGGAIAFFWPKLGDTVNLLLWLVPLVALIFFMFMGMLVASYRIHQESNQEFADREKDFQKVIASLKEQLAALTANPEATEARRRLMLLSEECDALLSWLQSGSQSLELQAVRKIEEWDSEILELVRDSYPKEYPKFMDNPFRGQIEWNVLTVNTAAIKGLVREQLKKLKVLLENQSQSG